MTGTGYHGTLTSNVESILKRGLRPRGKGVSHDEYLGRASYPEFVYLTDNPMLAAHHIIRIPERLYEGAAVTILHIDAIGLDDDLVYPDEDYLIEEGNGDISDWSHQKQLRFMKLHQDQWDLSLSERQSIAYKGVIKPTLIHATPATITAWCIEKQRGEWRLQDAKLKEIREAQ